MHMSNIARWENQYARSHSLFNQFEHRFLPQTEQNVDNGEQPLPEGTILFIRRTFTLKNFRDR